MDKSALRHVILTQLSAELDLLTRAAQMARDEATNEESKAENKYDTRGQEAAYLAEGQARHAAEIQVSLTLFQSLPLPAFAPTDPIAIGALVTLGTDAKSQTYLLAPRNGGMEITRPGLTPILLITPHSPVGRQLIGRRLGETIQLTQGKKNASLPITAIA